MQQEKSTSNSSSTQQKVLNNNTLLLLSILAEKLNSYLTLSPKIITDSFLEETQ